MAARWPGKIEPHSQSNHVSAHWDLLPTFCELAGITPPIDIDGVTMVPTLLGQPGEQQQHAYLYWEYGGLAAARAGNWKALSRLAKGDREPPVELYDLSQDIGETKDVTAEHPDVVAKMRAIIRDAHTDPQPSS